MDSSIRSWLGHEGTWAVGDRGRHRLRDQPPEVGIDAIHTSARRPADHAVGEPKGASDHRGAWEIERRTMRHLLFVGTLIAGLSGGIASGQASASALGSVHLTYAVIADGKPLA